MKYIIALTWVLIIIMIFQAQVSMKKIKELQKERTTTMEVKETPEPLQKGYEGICDLTMVVCANEKMEIVLQ